MMSIEVPLAQGVMAHGADHEHNNWHAAATAFGKAVLTGLEQGDKSRARKALTDMEFSLVQASHKPEEITAYTDLKAKLG